MSKIIFDKMTEVDEFDSLEDLGMFIDDEDNYDGDFQDEIEGEELDDNLEDGVDLNAYSSRRFGETLDEDDFDTNALDGAIAGATSTPCIRPVPGRRALKRAYCAGKRDGIREGRVLGYREGFRDGLERGKRIGYRAGYIAGFRDGRCKGFNEGKIAGYARGLCDGRAQGFEAGRRFGYREGFRAGFCAGYRAALCRRRGRFYPVNPFIF